MEPFRVRPPARAAGHLSSGKWLDADHLLSGETAQILLFV
jgi:hypothetical protein